MTEEDKKPQACWVADPFKFGTTRFGAHPFNGKPHINDALADTDPDKFDDDVLAVDRYCLVYFTGHPAQDQTQTPCYENLRLHETADAANSVAERLVFLFPKGVAAIIAGYAQAWHIKRRVLWGSLYRSLAVQARINAGTDNERLGRFPIETVQGWNKIAAFELQPQTNGELWLKLVIVPVWPSKKT